MGPINKLGKLYSPRGHQANVMCGTIGWGFGTIGAGTMGPGCGIIGCGAGGWGCGARALLKLLWVGGGWAGKAKLVGSKPKCLEPGKEGWAKTPWEKKNTMPFQFLKCPK